MVSAFSLNLVGQDGSEDEEAGDASSEVENDLAQRLKNLTPNDPDTLTRLPVRVSPGSHDNTDRTQGSPPTSGEVEAVPAEVTSVYCERYSILFGIIFLIM